MSMSSLSAGHALDLALLAVGVASVGGCLYAERAEIAATESWLAATLTSTFASLTKQQVGIQAAPPPAAAALAPRFLPSSLLPLSVDPHRTFTAWSLRLRPLGCCFVAASSACTRARTACRARARA
jgi:hypothetical protein